MLLFFFDFVTIIFILLLKIVYYKLVAGFFAFVGVDSWCGCYAGVFNQGGEQWHLIFLTAVAEVSTVTVVQTAIHQSSAQAHLHGRAEWWDSVTWYQEVRQVKQVHKYLVTIARNLMAKLW